MNLKKQLQNIGLTFFLISSFLTQFSAQNVGINAEQPEATLHVRSISTEELSVDFEDQTSGDLQIINGPWFYNNVSFEGDYSTNSGYLDNGQRLMRYTFEVPMDSFAIFSYYVKLEIHINGEYSLPFEDTLSGPKNKDWEHKSIRFGPGVHVAEWYVGNTQSPNTAGLMYVDDVQLTSYPVKPIMILESGNEGDGKVLTSDETGAASWQELPEVKTLIDKDLDTKIEVELNPDEDMIRFTTDGTERWRMEEDRLVPTGGQGSIFIGKEAGGVPIAGILSSIAIGDSALHSSQLNAINNLAIGKNGLKKNLQGSFNVAIGNRVLSECNNCQHNTGVGQLALYSNITGHRNTAIGKGALALNKTGSYNVATGNEAMRFSNTGLGNSAYGHYSLHSNGSGNANVAIGIATLFKNTDKSNLVAVGDSALYNNGYGAPQSHEAIYNTAIGSKTLYSNTTGYRNTALGYISLKENETGWGNTGIGSFSLLNNISGLNNTAIGGSSLNKNTTGSHNVASGHQALFSNESGHYNTASGSDALVNNTSGGYNVAIGALSLTKNENGRSNVAIGINTLEMNVDRSNLVAIGDSALLNNGVGATKLEDATANTAIGSKSLYNNTIGHHNTATGFQSLYHNDSGFFNVAMGTLALHSNESGYANIALGSSSIYSNTFGNNNIGIGRTTLFDNTTGSENVAIGVFSMEKNETGHANIAIGVSALKNSKEKSFNIAIGDSTLFHNGTSGTDPIFGIQNIAIGSKALLNNTEGYANTALGFESSFLILTGSHNTALGRKSLFSNLTSDNNTAVGSAALYETTGGNNTAVGSFALGYNTSGSQNTAVGYVASTIGVDLNNTTAIGYNAQCIASNTVRIGDNNVVSIGGIVEWTNLSDGRFKKNIKENVSGLALINKLRPVTYNIDTEAYQNWKVNKFGSQVVNESNRQSNLSSEIKTGFIAQEVESAAQSLGIDFSGVDAPKSEDGIYGLRYAAFTVPLVKAVQELSQQNEDLQGQLDTKNIEINELKQLLLKQTKILEIYDTRLSQLETKINK